MGFWRTLRIGAALSSADARINALVIDASAMIGAFVVGLAFSSDARAERVSCVSRWAGTNGSLALRSIVSGGANSVGAARIRATEIFRNEFTAADEGVASHVSRARADGSQASEVAVSVNAASAVARVLANSIVASWSGSGTVDVSVAFWSALSVGGSDVSFRAFTDSSMIDDALACRAFSALRTSFNALEVIAIFLRTALAIVFALMTASRQRLTGVAWKTRACWLTTDIFALGVDSTGRWVAWVLWK